MDKDTLIILQAITEGIAAVCKRLQKIEPKIAGEEVNPEDNNEEKLEQDEW